MWVALLTLADGSFVCLVFRRDVDSTKTQVSASAERLWLRFTGC